MQINQSHLTFGRHVGYLIFTNIVILLLGFIRLPILTKGLGASLYGVWAIINVTTLLLVPLALLTMDLAIVRFLAAAKDKNLIREDYFSVFSVILVTGSLFSAGLFVFSDKFAEIFLKGVQFAPFVKIASVLILLNSIQTYTLTFFRTFQKMGIYSFLSLLIPLIQISLIFTALFLKYELTGVIIAVIVSSLIVIAVNATIILKQIGFQWPRFKNIKTYLKWGMPLTPNAGILWISNVSDRYIVSYFLGVAAAGIYDVGYQLGYYALFIIGPLGTVVYPVLSKYYNEGNIFEVQKHLKYSFKYLMMLVIPCVFGLSILAEPLLRTLTTADFIPGKTVVPYVALGAVFYCLYQLCVYIMLLLNKIGWNVIILSTSAAVNIALNIILIPRVGIMGAAVATLIAYAIMGLLHLAVTRRYLKFDLSLTFIGKTVAAATVMTFCIWLINPQSLMMITLAIVVGAVLYFLVLLAIRAFSEREMDFLTSFIKDNVRRLYIKKG